MFKKKFWGVIMVIAILTLIVSWSTLTEDIPGGKYAVYKLPLLKTIVVTTDPGLVVPMGGDLKMYDITFQYSARLR